VDPSPEVQQVTGPSDRAGMPGTVGPLPERVLSDITHLLVSEDSPRQVLLAVAGALSELVPHQLLSIYRADPARRLLQAVLQLDAFADVAASPRIVPFGHGLAGAAAHSRVPRLVNDVHLQADGELGTEVSFGPHSILAVPLLARDELKGVLCLQRRGDRNHFSVRDFKVAIMFGELAALAIDNAEIRGRLETEVVTDHLTALYNHRYFHARLAEELRRSSRLHTTIGLLVFDIDDFKRVNDTWGHLMGDQVLQGVASLSREICRQEDVICRIGGEEFGVILPGSKLNEAATMADRLRDGIGRFSFPAVGRVTVSIGVAASPMHASSPRELIMCADFALLEAKDLGKDRVMLFGGGSDDVADSALDTAAPRTPASAIRRGHVNALVSRGELRSMAQLRAMQSFFTKLSRLSDVRKIGETIIEELPSLIDHDNARVHLLQPDGETLVPIAFRGTVSEYRGQTFEALLATVGEGITGQVVVTGRPHYAPEARKDPLAVSGQGGPKLDESILVVPILYGDRVIGTVGLSKLGIDQFDREDTRLLEVLAGNAGIALENARLLDVERRAAERSAALLEFCRALAAKRTVGAVLEEVLSTVPRLVRCPQVSAWLREPGGGLRLVAHGFDPQPVGGPDEVAVPAETAVAFLETVDLPVVVPIDVLATLPPELLRLAPVLRPVLVAPMRWEPHGLGALVVAPPAGGATFDGRDLELMSGIAEMASMALGNAFRFERLEAACLPVVQPPAGAPTGRDEHTRDPGTQTR
jgi:diguanylate cyclase (GGDEF)-like protein